MREIDKPPDPRLVVSSSGADEGVSRDRPNAAPTGSPISSASPQASPLQPPLASSRVLPFLPSTRYLALDRWRGFSFRQASHWPPNLPANDSRRIRCPPRFCPTGDLCALPFWVLQPAFPSSIFLCIRTMVDITFHNVLVVPAMSKFTATLFVLLTSPAPLRMNRPPHNPGYSVDHMWVLGSVLTI